jgi:predicted Zn finger-like uncharacterized protein
MRLTCPACEASYELPETMFLTGPRMVRCVRCSHSWLAGVPEPEAPPAEAVAAESPAAAAATEGAETTEATAGGRLGSKLRRRGPATEPPPPIPKLDMDMGPAPPPKAGALVLAGWVATAVVLALGAWLGLEFHQDIMAAWPASARLYGLLGIGHGG